MQSTQRIEGYDSFEQIALGGMATVYKARKISLDKMVAVKVLYPHLAQDVIFLERFKREALTAAKLQHDNIVNVVDCGETDGAYFIVMEYCEGLTLEELLKVQTDVPLDICFAIILNVCHGLEAAHSEGLVHRDVKPANIIYTHQGSVKIADFGLAKNVEQTNLVTQADKVVGTPAYMSPEQTRGERVGAQSDIFSLGVMAFELICGQRPFDGKTYSEVVDRIQFHDSTPVSTLNPMVDSSFSKIIQKMLEKKIEDRYQHIAEVLMDLEEAVDKQKYKRDRRTLSEYFKDPQEYLERYRIDQLEKLVVRPPRSDTDTNAKILYYQRLLILNPSDEKARHELERLGTNPPPPGTEPEQTEQTQSTTPVPDPPEPVSPVASDPDAEYRVFLESIDANQETPATFALKLSMRIRSPLPRVMSIVKNMPSMVAGHLSFRKANKLSSIIDELGGTARVAVHEESVSPAQKIEPETTTEPNPSPEPAAEERFDQGKTEQYNPIEQDRPERRAGQLKPKIACPKCDWEGDADARFCPICMFKFNKTDVLNLAALGQRVQENPLEPESHEKPSVTSLLSKITDAPPKVKYGAFGTLVILLLLIIFGR